MIIEYLISFNFSSNFFLLLYFAIPLLVFFNSSSGSDTFNFFPDSSGDNNNPDNWWKRFLVHLNKYRQYYLGFVVVVFSAFTLYLYYNRNINFESVAILNSILPVPLTISDHLFSNYVVNFDMAMNSCLNLMISTGFLENQFVVVDGNYLLFNFNGNRFVFPKELLGISNDSSIIISRVFYIGLFDCPINILNDLNSQEFLDSVNKFIIFVYQNYQYEEICNNFGLTNQQFLQFIVCFCLHQFVETHDILFI